MGIIYPNSMFSKPRGICSNGDWVSSLVAGYSPLALYAADRGLYKSVAAQFTAASSEYLSIASNATLQTGNVDFWIAGWFYFTALPAAGQILWDKWGGSTNEYAITIQPSGALECYHALEPVSSAAVSTGAWHFVLVWQDAIGGTWNIKVDNGATVSLTYGAAITAGNSAYCVGARDGAGFPFDGRIDSTMFGKNPVGGIAGVIAAINTSLYNGGSGKNYADLTAAEKTAWGLVSAWDLDELSGTRNDSHGTNHLADNNTVTSAAGKPNKLATANGDPIGLWLDQSGNGRHLSAAALANQPTLALAYQNGKPAVLFDGVDDYMLASAFQSFPSKRGVLIVVEKTTLAAGTSQLCGTYSAAAIDWLAYVTKSGTKYNWFDGVSDLLSATFDGAATELEVWHRDGDTSISHRRNAALADALTCANNQPSSDVLAVGASTTAGTPYKGGIMTIALFGDKTLAEVQAIESILNSAWAVY